MGAEPGEPRRPRGLHTPLPERRVLPPQVSVQRLQAAVLVGEGLALRGLALEERVQAPAVLLQGLVVRLQLLLLLLQVLTLPLLGLLLVLEQRELHGEQGPLGVQGGIFYLPGRRQGEGDDVSLGTGPKEPQTPNPHPPHAVRGQDRNNRDSSAGTQGLVWEGAQDLQGPSRGAQLCPVPLSTQGRFGANYVLSLDKSLGYPLWLLFFPFPREYCN